MQNQPKGAPVRHYGAITFDPDFPISSYNHKQLDLPIRALHAHNGIELGYCYSGSGIFVVEDKVLPFGAGDVSVINQHEMHLARSARGTVSEWNFTTFDPLQLLYAFPEDVPFLQADSLCGPDFNNIFKPRQHPGLGPLMKQIVDEIMHKKPGYRTILRGLIQALLVELHRARPQADKPVRELSADSKASERIMPALNLIAAEYTRRITLEELAGSCHMSITNFRRRFKTGLGISPFEYLTRFRIHMAMGLLERKDQSVIDIALDVGYETLSCFNRNFKRIAGCSPREWKKQQGAISRF